MESNFGRKWGITSIMSYDKGAIDEANTYWEKVAKTKWGAYISDIERRAVLRAHELSGEPSTAIEIGAEGGGWSKLLADLGWSIVCTDINEEALAICQKRIPTADCILVTPGQRELPCKTKSIALLLCIEVAPVIQANWFFAESFRVLQNNGLIVGVFWNLISFRGLFVHTIASVTGSIDWYKYSYLAWKKRLVATGYSIVYEEGCCWFPFRRDSNSNLVRYFVRLEKWLGLRRLTSISPWVVFVAQKTPKATP